MPNRRWLIAACGLLACGLLAAGCGDDEATVSAPTATTAETTSSENADGSTADDERSGGSESASEAIDADGVYGACLEAVEDAPSDAQARAQAACEKARSTFESCAKQAEATNDDVARKAAVAICQKAAEQAVTALEATG